MAACGLCNKVISAKHLKVNCSDCQKDFHGSCVKMSRADIEYLSAENGIWRCDSCSVNRRKSLRLDIQASEGNISLADIMKAISDLTENHKQSIKDFNISYEQLNEKLDENTKVMKEQNIKIDEYLEIIENLRRENKQLKEKLETLESRLEESEQYSRRNCIEIHGMPVENNNVLEAVKSVGKALNMNIEESMIDACHTLKKRPNVTGPPPIVVKFVRRMDAEEMLAKRRQKKQLSTRHMDLPSDMPVYINESLSPARRRLLAMAREARKQQHYKWIWVRGGKIFMKKEDEGQVIPIRTQADLGRL